jgi:PST family polysaccharide transporter
MVLLALTVAVVMTFCSNWVVALLFGESYAAAGAVLSVHIWAGLFIFLHVASGKWLVMEGFQKYALYRALLGAFVNIGFNVILIPINGVLGAAYATVISYLFAVFWVGISKKTRITALMMINSFVLHKSVSRIISSNIYSEN